MTIEYTTAGILVINFVSYVVPSIGFIAAAMMIRKQKPDTFWQWVPVVLLLLQSVIILAIGAEDIAYSILPLQG